MRAVKCCPHVSINPLWAAAGGRRADVVCVSVSTCHVKMKRKMEADSEKFEVVYMATRPGEHSKSEGGKKEERWQTKGKHVM